MSLFDELASLETEQINQNTLGIDLCSTEEILRLINDEDLKVAQAVRNELPNINIAVDLIVQSFKHKGKLFYVGAGTSGRLGILDASECPPTFGTNPEMVQGIIAGGKEAVFQAQEGAEDLEENGSREIVARGIKSQDIVCGLAASGRTPFVKGALAEAKARGCKTIMISTVNKAKLIDLGIETDVFITPDVGPEVIAGSTRMKSGTAQKLVLNMLTTSSMIKLGKTYGNVMIDLQLTNEKLKQRAIRIIMTLTNTNYQTAETTLKKADGHVKTAIVMLKKNISIEAAKELISKSEGFVRTAIEQ